MRNLNELNQYREKHPFWPQTDKAGSFKVFVGGRSFFVLASVDDVGEGEKWEHISVTPKNQKRCPTWEEMAAIKDMFFLPEEEAVEFHPKHSRYVNHHEYCLHIWRPTDGKLLRTPAEDLEKMETLAARDEKLEALWKKFADVPMNPDTEQIEAEFLHFPAGTDREEIWSWFDRRHSNGVAYLLYGGTEDYVPETRRLYRLKNLCIECDAEKCTFNPKGICLFPMVGERAPALSDDGCEDFCYKEGG